jgi:hypothetical protein
MPQAFFQDLQHGLGLHAAETLALEGDVGPSPTMILAEGASDLDVIFQTMILQVSLDQVYGFDIAP